MKKNAVKYQFCMMTFYRISMHLHLSIKHRFVLIMMCMPKYIGLYQHHSFIYICLLCPHIMPLRIRRREKYVVSDNLRNTIDYKSKSKAITVEYIIATVFLDYTQNCFLKRLKYFVQEYIWVYEVANNMDYTQ